MTKPVNPFLTRIPLKDDDSVFTYIDECYEKLEALPGFSTRPGQKDLSKEVCRSMVVGDPLAAEAPTGTGKTLAYLIGALAASERMQVGTGSNQVPAPIVIATATVGLQNQVISGDIPALVSAGILQDDEAVIAKGRSRYFCIQSAIRAMQENSTEGQYDFFDQDANHDMEASVEISRMNEMFDAQQWNGDVDTYDESRPKSWPIVAASANTCVGQRQCEYASECPFLLSRIRLTGRKIIVANHDFVLSDLAMGLDDTDKDTVIPYKNYLLIFDEAHHLPEKAMGIGVSDLSLSELALDVPKMVTFGRTWPRNPDIAQHFKYAKLKPEQFDISFLENAVSSVIYELKALRYEADTKQHLFPKGKVSADLLKSTTLALEHLTDFYSAMVDANNALKTFKTEGKNEVVVKLYRELLYSSANILGQLSGALTALKSFNDSARMVRWAFYVPEEKENGIKETLSLHVSPLDGTQILRKLLWDNERVRTAMVSATIQNISKFDRFQAKLGVGSNLRTMALAHIFPYQENELRVVNMKHSPRFDERDKFTEELKLNLSTHVEEGEGTLILFPSRSMMMAVLPILRSKFGRAVLSQADKGISELILDHKNRIDDGKGSILCGLATMAEGLDLPGNYCTHVVICTLPFAVPTTPVEREIAEIMGKRNFMERVVPEAMTKLTQMIGRLMRRETDRGRITIYDKRLIESRWGRQMLSALPNFRKKAIDGVRLPFRPTFPKGGVIAKPEDIPGMAPAAPFMVDEITAASLVSSEPEPISAEVERVKEQSGGKPIEARPTLTIVADKPIKAVDENSAEVEPAFTHSPKECVDGEFDPFAPEAVARSASGDNPFEDISDDSRPSQAIAASSLDKAVIEGSVMAPAAPVSKEDFEMEMALRGSSQEESIHRERVGRNATLVTEKEIQAVA